ncbi:MAG TPA: LPXTG cell wall anchor domain-containing protein [Gemmataceae bacterium]|nr:LPXTG cell wall anchor domain-containing protein [Gemmataceae bacterium]
MTFLLRHLVADWAPRPAPGPPLIGNNIVFYTVLGAALLVLLLLVLWVRRRGPRA